MISCNLNLWQIQAHPCVYVVSNIKAVYGCVIDLSKAFDLVEWTQLFKILIEKKVAPIFLRIMLFVYRNQYCEVRWGTMKSDRFLVHNGVRQGAVSSPILFSIYIDGLIKELRDSGLGCKIERFYYGCLGYADDLLLLSASRSGLQSMVKICEKFAKLKGLKFSTSEDPAKSKTKCIIFTKGKTPEAENIRLNGDPLPWVRDVKHLGNILQSDNSMRSDCLAKRGKFIGIVNAMMQEFHFVNPDILVKLINIYATSFYGSVLWKLNSPQVDKIYKTWNVTIRNIYGLPWKTHRYWVEKISGCYHPKTFLSSRMVKFAKSLIQCNKVGVRFLASLCLEDRRTVMGMNMSNIADEASADIGTLTPTNVKNALKYSSFPEDEEWRIPVVQELLDLRSSRQLIDNMTSEDINSMLDLLCTN